MKKLAILFASMFIMTIAVQNVNAQSLATVPDAQAGATIIATIALTNNLSLEFGKIVKSSGGGEVFISPSATPDRVPTGGLTFIAGDIWRPAKFTVAADDNQSFSIIKPETITLDGPGSSEMTITTIISGPITGVTTSDGSYEFFIGGLLPVAAAQQIGAYIGTYEVRVQYE